MSVSEREQAKPAHRERRMTIMNEVHDIMSVSEREQAKPEYSANPKIVQKER